MDNVFFCKANKIVIPDWMLEHCKKTKCQWLVEMSVDEAIREVDCATQTSLHA